MAEIFSVTVEEIIKQLNMEIIYAPENISSLVVTENDCNRPGLQLMGFYEYFNAERVQICGNMEFAYLASLDEKTRYERIDALFATKIPLFIVARGHELYPEMVEIAKKYGVPIARTQDSTTAFIAALIGYLNVELAPRITRHGVLIEVYGEGILIVGESGVGKSETAIELVKRGHRLVADDAVEIRKTSNRTLVGSSPDNIRHFLEQLCLLQCVLSRCGIQHQIYLSVCRRVFSLDDTRNLLQFLHQVFLVVQTPCRIAD